METGYEHYLLEKKLAAKLREAPKEERKQLYGPLYSELFAAIATHYQMNETDESADVIWKIKVRDRLLAPYYNRGLSIIEFGCGSAVIARSLAGHFKAVSLVEACDTLLHSGGLPENTCVFNADCSDLDYVNEKFDLAYSDNLFEHLHPEDAKDHLKAVFDVLRPGGVYVLQTPNRAGGPHDVSHAYDDVATGFHLKEYRAHELKELCEQTGFVDCKLRLRVNAYSPPCPFWLASLAESLLLALPGQTRKKLAASKLLRPLNSLTVFARKP